LTVAKPILMFITGDVRGSTLEPHGGYKLHELMSQNKSYLYTNK